MRWWSLLALGACLSCGRVGYDAEGASVAVVDCASPEATPGALDESFADGGVARLVVGTNGSDLAQGVREDGQGNLFVGIQSLSELQNDVAVVRLLSDGSLDTSFGTSGVARYQGALNEFVRAIAIDGSGRIVVGGGTASLGGGSGAAVVRFTSAGALDLEFGAGGVSLLQFDPAVEDRVTGVDVDGAGRILAIGHTETTVDAGTGFLARILDDGSLDTSFADTGIMELTEPDGTRNSGETVLLVGTDLLAVGSLEAEAADNGDYGAWRLDDTGVPVASWAVDGIARAGETRDVRVWDASIAGDGRILVAGHRWNGTHNTGAVAAFLADGTLDASFGVAGQVVLDTPEQSRLYRVRDAGGGRIVAIGDVVIAGEPSMGIWRFDSSGQIDGSFADQGFLRLDFDQADLLDTAQQEESLHDLHIDSDGRIVASGWSTRTETVRDAVVVRVCQ